MFNNIKHFFYFEQIFLNSIKIKCTTFNENVQNVIHFDNTKKQILSSKFSEKNPFQCYEIKLGN